MTFLAGFLVVIVSVIGGFVLAGGTPLVLYQPAEFMIIGGSAVGILVVSTPTHVGKLLMAQLRAVAGRGVRREEYVQLLSMLYQLFRIVQQSGVMALEPHFEEPKSSSVLSRFPSFLARDHALSFLSDSVKVMISGGMSTHDLEALMDEDLHVHQEEALKPSATVAKIGDALPGLGIVAAVLGVVNTMAHIDGPPAEIGEKVGAALIGTFLGILLSYGFAQPISMKLEHIVAEELGYLQCIKHGLLAVCKGMPPAIAIEFARRALPDAVRPSFEDTERACRGKSEAAPAAAAA